MNCRTFHFKSGRIEYVILDETLPMNDIVFIYKWWSKKNSVKACCE